MSKTKYVEHLPFVFLLFSISLNICLATRLNPFPNLQALDVEIDFHDHLLRDVALNDISESHQVEQEDDDCLHESESSTGTFLASSEFPVWDSSADSVDTLACSEPGGIRVEPSSRSLMSPEGPKLAKQHKKNAYRKRRRSEKRAALSSTAEEKLRKALKAKKRAHNMVSNCVSANLFAAELSVSSEGWQGHRTLRSGDFPRELSLLLETGFRLVSWDGIVPTPIRDSAGRVIALLAGRADGANISEGSYMSNMRVLAQLFRVLRVAFPVECSSAKLHRRGTHASCHVGVSMGGGQKEPMRMRIGKLHASLYQLLKHPAMLRLIGFVNRSFESFFPEIRRRYSNVADLLQQRYPDLIWNGETVFAGLTFNLGRAVVCSPHRDHHNLGYGLCAVTSLGTFDPDFGGHLVLHELGLVVRFPPGATILLPSAAITHYNVPIRQFEDRYSVVQYSAAGLFRFVERGFATQEEFEARILPTTRERNASRLRRIEEALSSFLLWEDDQK